MVEGRRKSRTFRRKQVRVSSGKTITHYYRRKPAKAQCAGCGDYLKGTAKDFPNKIRSMARTKKRPSRPFGGVLCSSCMRSKIVNKYRNAFSLSSK